MNGGSEVVETTPPRLVLEPTIREVESEDVLEVGRCVLAQSSNIIGWYAGTVVGNSGNDSYRVVFVDGSVANGVERSALRIWNRPVETAWHKRRKLDKQGRRVDLAHSAQRPVEQLDVENRESVARFPTARKACEELRWISGPEDVVACCRGMTPQAGGYAWRFAEAAAKVDAADVDELLSKRVVVFRDRENAGSHAKVKFQQINPKRVGSKSHMLYEAYKKAGTLREMLALGGRRADISYDLGHGWITFEDPELARRFSFKTSAGSLGRKLQKGPERPQDLEKKKQESTATT